MARLYRVVLPVRDIDQAAAFYADLLEDGGRRVSPGRHYFACGGTILACYDPRADGDPFDARPNPDHVYFAVDDLEAAFARASRAGCLEIEGGIETRPWGERSFYARDPFGNPICFVDERTVFTGAEAMGGTTTAGSGSRLRLATPADTPGVQRLIAEVYSEYDCVLILDEEPHLKDPADHFRSSGGEFWVVENGGTVRATVAVALRPDAAELKTLYVHPSLRKQGWGGRLVAVAMDHARNAGRRVLYLWSDTRFLDAHRLYRKLGFQEGGLRDLHDSNRSVERRFERRIDAPGSLEDGGRS